MSKRKRVPGFGPTRAPRCVVLCRVSTDEQHLDVQRVALLTEAQRRGFDVVETIEDTGSGRKMDEREGLRRVLELAEARAVDVVLVAELSRIGRSLAGVAAVVERLAARDVALISLREQFDISSPVGRLLVGILGAVAAFEVDVLSQRTSAGMQAAARRGRAVGGAPFGTRWELRGEQPAELVPVAEEIATLRRAVSLRALLGRWDLATDLLNAEGYLTRTGRPWRADAVSAACRNPRVEPLLADGPDAVAAAA